MTNPTPANDWSALDLPVLTDVVDIEPGSAPEVPVYDFTAELDALAQAVPGEDVPELVLPPELSLDDVLGDDLPADDASLSASQLIERLPSLDLEVDLPAELVLDDVLPGLERQRPPVQAEAATAVEEFDFSLDEEPSPVPASEEGSGLGALFARASFEPLVPPADSMPLSDSATVDRLTAQLDDFDVPAEMPELPVDAFLSEASDGEVPAEVFAADSLDDAWASTWTPPSPVVPTLEAALPEVPTLDAEAAFDGVPTLSAAPLADWPQPERAFADIPVMQVAADIAPVQAPVAGLSGEPVADSLPADEVVLDWLEDTAGSADLADPLGFEPAANPGDPLTAVHDAPSAQTSLPAWAQPDAGVPAAPAVPAEAETPAAAMPWDQPAAAVDDIPSLALSVDDILASLQAAPAPTQALAAADEALPPPAAIDMPAAAATAPWPAQAEPTPFAAAPALTPLVDDVPTVSASLLDNATLQQPEPAAAFDVAAQAAAFDAAPQPEPETTLAAVPPQLTSISLDSLPTGVLGGGLGLSAAEVPPAATLGQPAAALPGGGEWLATRPAFNADDKEVELAWARDLGAEPPLDLDQLPQAEAVPAAAPVIAEVIRVRRTMPLPASEPVPVAHLATPAAPAEVAPEPALAVDFAVPPPQAEPPLAPAIGQGTLPDETIRIEAVSAALPMPAAEPPAAKPDLDEEVLIEALYARVLPRMKVELTLWMQDALEQQAKQLMAGVMKQLKEDFDMMLAESLRSALREAMDEAAGKLGARDD